MRNHVVVTRLGAVGDDFKLPRKRRNYTLMSFLAAAGLLKLGLILSVMFLRKGAAKPNVLVFKMPDDVRLVPFKNHTTVADTPGLCDPISRKIYARHGSVADCAVAFVLCMAVVAPHRIGLAGGFFATVYISYATDPNISFHIYLKEKHLRTE
ncbi:hypothetical protein HPB47_009063 [Ixodes persulcatus]|uniref:Uncharacterized protein n=1 Tax=Ixodes persulcatus TaxID=34615 RepID=A0AC60P3J1_IXOPE|nr:hypothetical protein HPB47_009063 [Ixodes persulcatus]